MNFAPWLTMIAQSTSEEDLLGRTALYIQEAARADACEILILHGDEELVLAASTHSPEFHGRIRMSGKLGVVGTVLKRQAPVFVKDRSARPSVAVDFPGYDEDRFEASTYFPLGGLGVVILRRFLPWAPSAHEVKRLNALLDDATDALLAFRNAYNQGLGEDRLEALSTVTSTIEKSPYLEEILQLLVNLTAQQMGYRVCTVRLLDEKNGELILRATQATMPEYQRKRSIKVGESIAGRVVQTMQPIVLFDVQAEADYIGHDLAREQGLRSMACVPLSVQDKPLGVLTVYTDEAREFHESELLALETIAKQASYGIERAKLQVRHTLMQEMHHRVKNNLQQVVSLLRLQLRHKHTKSIEAAMNDSIGRIHAIAAVHDLLSREDLDRVGLKTIAGSLVHHMQQAMVGPEAKIQFEVKGDEVQLGMTQATQVALVLNELMQNALEHGLEGCREGNVHVTIESKEGNVSLWVSNDGNALPLGFDLTQDSHLGLQIVANLARGLGGTFKLEDRLGWAVAEVIFKRGFGGD